MDRYLWTSSFVVAGSDGTLRMRPIKELETLRMKEDMVSNVKVNSGSEVN